MVIRRFTRKRVDFWIFGRFSTKIHVEMTVRWIGGTQMTKTKHLRSAPRKKLLEEHAPLSTLFAVTRHHNAQGSMQNLGVVICKDAVPMSFRLLRSLSGSCRDVEGAPRRRWEWSAKYRSVECDLFCIALKVQCARRAQPLFNCNGGNSDCFDRLSD